MRIRLGVVSEVAVLCILLLVGSVGIVAFQSNSVSAIRDQITDAELTRTDQCMAPRYLPLVCIDVPRDCTPPPETFCDDQSDDRDTICTHATGAGGTDCEFTCYCAVGPPCWSYAEECKYGCDTRLPQCFEA